MNDVNKEYRKHQQQQRLIAHDYFSNGINRFSDRYHRMMTEEQKMWDLIGGTIGDITKTILTPIEDKMEFDLSELRGRHANAALYVKDYDTYLVHADGSITRFDVMPMSDEDMAIFDRINAAKA